MFRLIKSTLLVLFSAWLLALSAQASAQDSSKPAFISDALFVFLHSGPNNQYRIIGTVNAGQSVTFLQEDSDTGQNQTGNDSCGIPHLRPFSALLMHLLNALTFAFTTVNSCRMV